MTAYELSRNFFDWSFENTSLVKPTHVALYFFIIEHNNRLGWKPQFGLPMEMAKNAIGISNYKTYSKTFEDLIEWGFIKVFQRSKNQYSSNIIGLVKNTKATTKALSKATLKHSQKQVHGIVCIDKPDNLITNNNDDVENSTTSTNLEDSKSYINGEKTLSACVHSLKSNQIQISNIGIKFRLSAEGIATWIDQFEIHLKSLGVVTKPNQSEFDRHFNSWMNKQNTTATVKTFDNPEKRKVL